MSFNESVRLLMPATGGFHERMSHRMLFSLSVAKWTCFLLIIGRGRCFGRTTLTTFHAGPGDLGGSARVTKLSVGCSTICGFVVGMRFCGTVAGMSEDSASCNEDTVCGDCVVIAPLMRDMVSSRVDMGASRNVGDVGERRGASIGELMDGDNIAERGCSEPGPCVA
jgi:hypothetical protein